MRRYALQREKLVMLAGLALVLVPLALATAYVVGRYAGARQSLDQIQPRYARLLGLEAGREDLKVTEARAAAMLARQTYPKAQDASLAGNDAQQRIREVFTAAKLSIVSSQVLPAKQEKSLDRIPLSVRAEGDLLSMQAALTGLANLSPGIYVEGVTIQNAGVPRPDGQPRLAIQFNLFVLRVRT